MTAMDYLGRRVDESLEQVPGAESDLSHARAHFLSSDQRLEKRGPGAYFLWSASGLFLVALLIVLLRPEPQLVLQVDGRAHVPGTPIVGTHDDGLPLTFSDGSSVLLSRGAEALLVELTPSGAQINLIEGSAEVSVVHRDDTEFSFRAGPYLVLVTGTRFTLSWDRDDGTFLLRMYNGSVRVSGPEFSVPRVVVAGQQLRLSREGPSQLFPVSRRPPKIEVSPERETEPPPAMTEEADVTSRPAGTRTLPTTAKRARAWTELAREGKYVAAVNRAEQQGVSGILSGASGAELMLLADSAVYAGRSNLAQQTLTTIRRRFPGRDVAAQAAFALGRLSPGGKGLRWFETYLDERPYGPLAREALGRVLEARAASKNPRSGVSIAQQYLARFPEGPRAELAAQIIKSAE